MSVGIAEVDALAAERPGDATFYEDGVRGQMCFPFHECGLGDGEGYVELAGASVGRDYAAGQGNGNRGFAAFEEQEDIAASYGVGAEAVVAGDALETEDGFVEVRGAGNIVDVERGFENAGEWGSLSDKRHGRILVGLWERG